MKERRDALAKEVRFFASSDLQADAQTLVGHVAARWAIEVLFADGKELLGMQQLIEGGAVEALAFALRLYIEQDECVCDAERCPANCKGCMFCIAHYTLRRIGEEA